MLHTGVRHGIQQPQRVGHIVAKILAGAMHGLAHVGEPGKVDHGLDPVGFDYFVN